MDYIMVSLQTGIGAPCDLRVPAFVPVEELIPMLIEALDLNIPSQAQLQAEPLGRILSKQRTLEQEGVYHGALLTLI